jgi:hypothetical protein
MTLLVDLRQAERCSVSPETRYEERNVPQMLLKMYENLIYNCRHTVMEAPGFSSSQRVVVVN